MEHIKQLKKIRADAIARIRAGDDFKLAGKLGLLIVELGDTVDDTIDYGQSYNTTTNMAARGKASALDLPPVAAEPHPFEKAFAKSDEEGVAADDAAIDQLVAEMDNGTTEIDALTEKPVASTGHVSNSGSPFLKSAKDTYANGASH